MRTPFFQQHPAPHIAIVDEHIVEWNAAFAAAVGTLPDDIQHKPYQSFRPAAGPDAYPVPGGTLPVRFLVFNDTPFAVARAWGEGNAESPLFLELAPPYWPGVANALAEQMPVGLGVACRESGQFIYANQRLADMVGVSKDYILARKLQDIKERLHPDDLSRFEALARHGLDPALQPNDGIVRLLHSDGHYQWMHRTVLPLQGDSAQGYLAAIHIDVTQQKAREDDILQQLGILQCIADVLAFLAGNLTNEQSLFKALEMLGKAVGASRSYLYFDKTEVDFLVLEWAAPTMPSVLGLVDFEADTLDNRFQGIIRELRSGKAINISIQELEDEGAAYFKHVGAKWLLVSPISYAGKVIGYLGFDTVNELNTWNLYHTTALNVVANALGAQWIRHSIERKMIVESAKLDAVMSSARNPIMALDSEAKVLFYNQAAFEVYQRFGLEPILGAPINNSKRKWGQMLFEIIMKVVATREPIRFELPVIEHDQMLNFFDVSISPIGQPDQPPVGALIVSYDKTEDVLRQQDLSAALERFRLVSLAAPGGIWEFTILNGDPYNEGNRMHYSKRFYDFFGYKGVHNDEYDPDFWSNGIHPDDKDYAVASYFGHATNPASLTMDIEYRFKCTDGCYRWVRDICATERDSDGKPIRSVGLMTVIQQDKDREEALRNSLRDAEEAQLKLKEAMRLLALRNHLFDAAGEAQLLTLNGKWVDANPAAANLFGYDSKDQLLGLGPWDVSPEYQKGGGLSRELIPQKFEELNQKGHIIFPWIHQRADGTPFPSEVALTQLDYEGTSYVLAMIRDMTERTEYEDKLLTTVQRLEESREQTLQAQREAEEQRLRVEAIMNSLDDVILAFDSNLTLTHFNNTFRDTLAGFGLQAKPGMPAQETLNEEDFHRSLPYLHRALNGERIDFVFDFRYADESPLTYYRHRKINPVIGPDGEVSGVVIYSRDISAQKWIEQENRERERRMESQKSALHAITRSELLISGDIVSVSKELCKAAAETLAVQRVGLWLLNNEGLNNIMTYILDRQEYMISPLLAFSAAPEYYRLLFANEPIVVNDTSEGPLWNELGAYYTDESITSMLDVQVHRGKKVVGVLCLEHKGPKRTWLPDEQRFAVSIAEMMSLALEAKERLETLQRLEVATAELEAREEELRQNIEEIAAMQDNLVQALDVAETRRAQLEAVLNASSDLILAVDANCTITLMNEACKRVLESQGIDAEHLDSLNDITSQMKGLVGAAIHPDSHFDDILRGLTGEVFSYEHQTVMPATGELVYWVRNINPIRDKQNAVQGALVVGRDITQRKLAELELVRKNKELEAARYAEETGRRQLEAILNSTQDVIVAVDSDLRVIDFNKSYQHQLAIWGIEARIGQHISETVEPEDWEASRLLLQSALDGQQVEQEITRWFNGQQIYAIRSFNPFFDHENRVVGIVIFSKNITDRKLAELRLVNEKNRVSAIINSSPDLIIAFDTQGCVTLFNSSASHFSNQQQKPMHEGMHTTEVYPSGSLPNYAELTRRVLAGDTQKVVMEVKTSESALAYHEVTFSPILNEERKVVGAVAIGRDITERVLFEERLRRKNDELELAWQEAETQRFQIAAIINSTDDYIVAVNDKRQLVYFNDSFRKLMSGMNKDVRTGMPSLEAVNPQFRDTIASFGTEALRGQTLRKELKYQFSADGPYYYFDFTYTPMPAATGGYNGYVLFAKDITQRKMAELELHYKNEELQAQQEELRSNLDQLEAANRQLEAAKNELSDTYERLKAAQSQLVHSEKMSSLGQLTAGIAHEINNPINYVHNGVEALKLNLEVILTVADKYNNLDGLRDKEALLAELANIAAYKTENYYTQVRKMLPDVVDKIKIGSSRTAEIVRGLRNFSRLDEAELKKADIHEGIDSTLLLLSSKLKQGIQVDRCYDPSIPLIDCYAGQLNQVFMNIISNAIDAFDEAEVQHPLITITTVLAPGGGSVVVSISDNAKGIPPEIQARIFDPFFTTKAVGKGTGLGLSISYGIVEKHRGRIELESTPGQGTTFHVALPVEIK